MGMQQVREAWNRAAPAYPCSEALMHRMPNGSHDVTLSFAGSGPDGSAFSVTTDPFDAGLDPTAYAATFARSFAEKGTK